MFIPFLVDGIATKYAWQRSSRDQPELCVDLADDGLAQTNCRRCFEGKGEIVQNIDPVTGAVSTVDVDTPQLPGGIDPTSFLFTMISISVLFQAIAFISLGTLGDYGDYRKKGLVAASTVGGIATCMYVIVPADASLYWLGGVLMIAANVSLGVSVVFYNSYLPLMVDESKEVKDASGGVEKGTKSEQDVIDAQEAVSSEISSKGQMAGYVGGTGCLVLSVIVLLVLTAIGMDWYWALGVTSALSGVWWLVFAYFAFQRLPDRPGPPFPAGMSKYTEGWRRTHRLLTHLWRSERNTFYFLILFFIFSDGYSTISTVAVMFAYHELCMDPLLLALIAIIVPFTAIGGGYAWFRFQRKYGWTSKSVLVLNLLLLSLIPLWGCVGFFNDEFGLHTQGEMYVLAVWFGLCLGSAQAFSRALFSELIPAGHEADMFALFEITDKGSSWLGPLVAAAVRQQVSLFYFLLWAIRLTRVFCLQTGRIRPTLFYLLAAMVLPGLALHALDLTESIENARRSKSARAEGKETLDI